MAPSKRRHPTHTAQKSVQASSSKPYAKSKPPNPAPKRFLKKHRQADLTEELDGLLADLGGHLTKRKTKEAKKQEVVSVVEREQVELEKAEEKHQKLQSDIDDALTKLTSM